LWRWWVVVELSIHHVPLTTHYSLRTTHVQMSEVEATQGMRAHIGMKAKLRKVDGIQL